VNELATLLGSAAGQAPRVQHADPRPGELRHSSLDASRLRKLGWEPRVEVAEGLAETFRWIARAGPPSS
jgi:UDP-glucose 4-epimerase